MSEESKQADLGRDMTFYDLDCMATRARQIANAIEVAKDALNHLDYQRGYDVLAETEAQTRALAQRIGDWNTCPDELDAQEETA